MTRTRRDDDAYGQVDVALIEMTPKAVHLIESNSRQRAWIPRALLSYLSDELLESNGQLPANATPTKHDFETVEIKLWKLREIGWL